MCEALYIYIYIRMNFKIYSGEEGGGEGMKLD
jgi:hypothetical protein